MLYAKAGFDLGVFFILVKLKPFNYSFF